MDRKAVLAVTIGVIVTVLFAAVATSGTVRYADSPPVFIEQPDETERRTELRIETEITGFLDDADALELPPWIEAVARLGFWIILTLGAALALARLWHNRPSFRWRRRGPRPDDFDVLPDAAAAITDDADEQRAALRTGQPRHAIVACWLRVEAAIVDAGVERRASDTSTDLVERVLGEYRLDSAAIGDLAALYREARFSDHDMSETARTEALSALDEVHAGLRRAASVAT